MAIDKLGSLFSGSAASSGLWKAKPSNEPSAGWQGVGGKPSTLSTAPTTDVVSMSKLSEAFAKESSGIFKHLDDKTRAFLDDLVKSNAMSADDVVKGVTFMVRSAQATAQAKENAGNGKNAGADDLLSSFPFNTAKKHAELLAKENISEDMMASGGTTSAQLHQGLMNVSKQMNKLKEEYEQSDAAKNGKIGGPIKVSDAFYIGDGAEMKAASALMKLGFDNSVLKGMHKNL